MGRRRKSSPATDIPAVCQRFDRLLRGEFGNSVTLMAATLGVSHTALSRVINKGQMPSGQMLVGLAKLGRVNLHWLLAGGDEGMRGGNVADHVPVCDRLLPGAPWATPELLDPVGLPTSSPFLLDAAYWFRVPAHSPLVARPEERVAVGDYLLIETGPAWVTRPEAYVGRIVVLSHATNQSRLLARVGDKDLFAEATCHELDTFGSPADARLFTESQRPGAKPASPAGRRSGEGHDFYLDDIVGVVLEKRTLYPSRRM